MASDALDGEGEGDGVGSDGMVRGAGMRFRRRARCSPSSQISDTLLGKEVGDGRGGSKGVMLAQEDSRPQEEHVLVKSSRGHCAHGVV